MGKLSVSVVSSQVGFSMSFLAAARRYAPTPTRSPLMEAKAKEIYHFLSVFWSHETRSCQD
jgi:hypothetical protein